MRIDHATASCVLVGLLVLTPGADVRAGDKGADWLQFRGAFSRGVSADKGVPLKWSQTENLLWKTDVAGTGTSSPILLGSHIYLTSYSGYDVPGQASGRMENLKLHLVCLNRADGKLVWKQTVEPKLQERANIREGHGYASSTPVTDGERLYVFFGKSGVLAFDLEGKQLWRADVGSKVNDWGSAASPVLHGDLVIVNASVESDSLYALNKKTGEVVWKTGGIRESWNTPILAKTADGKTELVVAIMGKVLGIEPATGEQLWSCKTDIPWYMVPTLVEHEGIVYAVGGRNPGGALAVRTGGRGEVTSTHRLWKAPKGTNVPSPIYHQGHIYWVHDVLGTAFCVEAQTGKIVYEERIPRAEGLYASPVLVHDKLYYTSRTGTTYVLPAQPKFEVLAANSLNDRSTFNASPAVGGGRLYLRSVKYLYCIGQ